VFRHEDRFTHGIPDFAIHGNGVSSFLEIKYTTTGRIKFTGAQKLTLRRLHAQGMKSFLVIFSDLEGEKFIDVFSAETLEKDDDWVGKRIFKFDYDAFIRGVGMIHGL
jgi:hypothetical protein